MPAEIYGEKYPFLPRPELLTFEEIERLARLFVDLGVRKIRITGGEPLLRAELPKLIERLAAIEGLADLTLTTNGTLLASRAQALKDAGLRRVTSSGPGGSSRASRPPTRPGCARSRSTASSSAAATRTLPSRLRASSRAAATSCASSSSWTWARSTTGTWRRS
jgi:hypothetical protein